MNWHLVADWRKDLGIPSDPHFATGSASAGAPKDNNHLHAVIESRFALNGTMVSLPGVNLIATNDQAEKLEQLLIARWGEKAARIYLDSVVYPHLARAATSGEMRTAWDSVVTEGAKSYEAVITAQSPFEKRSVGMKALFQYDPKRAPVQLAAMLSGQTDETMYQMMKAKDERLKTIQNKYKLPDDYQNKTDPASFTPDPGWLTLGDYKDKLAGQKEAFIEASGMSEEDLKAIAKEKKIPYPFDAANIPDNPWAAQKIYNDFRDAVAQKQEKATVFATADVGIQDVNPIYDHPAAGIRSGAQYAPSDALTVSANIYAGAGESHLIQEEPTLLEGKAYAVTGGVAVNPLQSKTRWHRGTMMALELIYSDGNKLPEYFTPHLTLAPTVAFGDNSPVTFTPSLDLYWGLDQEGGADIGLVIGGFKLAYDFGSGTSVYGAYQLKWLSVKDEIQSADAERPGSTLNRPVEGPAETDNALSATAGFTRPQHRGAIGVARGPLSGEFGVVRGAQNNVYNDASEGAGAKAWVDFTLKYRF
ncbi:MAG: hypothetical protein HY609_04325 [Deltaproteobacteria bacterium]|nr:hypothetical protein [Deltaproteobacteria bacterium]